MNKTDGLGPIACCRRSRRRRSSASARSIHPVSALKGDGVEALLADLAELLPAGPAYFPDGVATDQPVEHRIAELVREQALRLTRDEVPHAVAVEVDEVRAKRGARTVVEARLICETESQKGILVGRGGAMVKAIGTAARPGVEALPRHRRLSRAQGPRPAALAPRLGRARPARRLRYTGPVDASLTGRDRPPGEPIPFAPPAIFPRADCRCRRLIG